MKQGFLGRVRGHGTRMGAGLTVAALLSLALSLVLATPASAEPEALAVHGYQEDFGVSASEAEEHLETQEEGAGIAEQLEEIQGNRYAGVWFDNESGEFVIPTAGATGQAFVASVLEGTGLEGDFSTKSVQYSWDELEAAQGRINEALMPLIEESLVQTSLDPQANAVVIHEADGLGGAGENEIAEQVAGEAVNVVVRSSDLKRFGVGVKACRTTSPRACGRPLRGGVSLTPTCQNCTYAVGECSAGFKATGGGNRYMLTAGHCAAKFSHWGSEDAGGTWHDIGVVAQASFPVHDWAAINANGSAYWDWTPWPTEVAHYWEDQERQITAESDSYVGEYVCHSGNKSGTSCGNVGGLNQTVTDSFSGNVIEHEVEFNNVCSIGGDSGGPVFAGNTALGLYSASTYESYPGACDAIAYYVEITEATDALGVSVAPRVARPYSGEVAFQANTGDLWTLSPEGVGTHYGLGLSPGTSPASARLATGVDEIAFQANSHRLWTFLPPSTPTEFGLELAAGTSPNIGGLSNGSYEVAFQANTHRLWTYSPSGGATEFGLELLGGTSPSVTGGVSNGGYMIAFQANTHRLWTYSPSGGATEFGLELAAGTSPSITGLSNGSYVIAFQANTGNLWTYTPAGGAVNRGLGMAAGTSPSVAPQPNGGWVVAFQANTGQLWTLISSGGSANRGLGMASGTSPAVGELPNGNYKIALQANTHRLWTYSSSGGSTEYGLELAAGTSPSIGR